MKGIIARLITLRQEIIDFEEALLEGEICYEGTNGKVTSVNFQEQTMTILLENEDDNKKEITVAFKEYLKLH